MTMHNALMQYVHVRLFV